MTKKKAKTLIRGYRKFPLFLLLITIPILLPLSLLYSQQKTPYIRYKMQYGQKYLYLSDIASFYSASLIKSQDGCEIRSKNINFKFEYQKRTGYFNNLKIHYLFAPVLAPPEPLISEKDFLYLMEPLARPAIAIPKKIVKNIVIDPGHGGKDNGAETIYREKNINLQIALKLRTALKAKGFNVFLTREKDMQLELEDRTKIAANLKADLFISIHCNSAPNRYIRGIETYILTPQGAPSTADKNPSTTAQKGNSFDKQNALLGYLIQRILIGNTAAPDRGLRHARFAVLKSAPCPAVLVECGFLSNEVDARNLAWAKYQQSIADSIAEAVAIYARTTR